MKRITTPLTAKIIKDLKAGDRVLITGEIYTGRDAAHKRFFEALDRGEKLPFPIEGAIIYYVGPSPAKPGKPVGSAGPTTSYRMDTYAPRLIQLGLKGMIGKGARAKEVKDAMIRHGAVYFATTGGAAALIAKTITAAEVVAYGDLGPEAVSKYTVKDFPVVVINDVHGNDLYEQGVAEYAETI